MAEGQRPNARLPPPQNTQKPRDLISIPETAYKKPGHSTQKNEIMTKRSYNRRTDEEIISDYQKQIKALEVRIMEKSRQDTPVLKELPKMKRKLAQFAQTCVDYGRGDLSNSTLAFMATLERQAQETVDA